jgi:hypothetical protein
VQLAVSYKNNSNAFKLAFLNIKVRDGVCCPGVIIPGGIHEYKGSNGADATNIPYNKTYADLLNASNSEWYFTRDATKDLCVYYRDASTHETNKAGNPTNLFWWSADSDGPYTPASDDYAVTLCDLESGINGVDAIDRAGVSGAKAWRLPNIAELGRMSSVAVSGGVEGASIRYYQLTSVVGADPRTTNMEQVYYWSSTEYSTSSAMIWRYLLSDTAGSQLKLSPAKGRVRCVRTMD